MGNCFGKSATSTEPSSASRPVQAGNPREAQPSVSQAAPTHPPPIPSSGPSRTPSVSSRRGSSQRHTRSTSQYEGERPLRNSGVVTSERSERSERGRSQTLQNSPPQEIHLQQYSSGGTDSSQRHRTKSMNAPQRQRSQSSGPRPRTASASASASQAVSTSSPEGRPRFPSSLQSLLTNEFRFRILVVGKRESGKSSLINAVFNVDMSGTPKNASGRTAEFRPRDNRYLVVHECSGYGPGELQAIRDFVMMYSHKNRPASAKLHLIWICVPVSDAINGQFDESVRMLLGLGAPVVLVFTKLDVIVGGNDYKSALAMASPKCEELRRSLFGNARAEIVSTQPRLRNFIEKLVTTTDEVVVAHSRNISTSSEAQRTQPRILPVALAWSVSQRASRDINIQATIEVGRSRYWRGLGSSDDFTGRILANCVEVIHADIVSVWNLLETDKLLSGSAFRLDFSHLVQDLSTSSKRQPNSKPGTGAPWLNSRYENNNENICLVVAYIVDLTLILCGVFGSPNVSSDRVQSVKNNFARSEFKSNIHVEIRRFIETVPKFKYYDNDIIVEKIIDLVTQNSDQLSTV